MGLGVPIILIVGFFGSHCNRPRWIGIGMFIISIGSLLYSVPHFTTGVMILQYKYVDICNKYVYYLDKIWKVKKLFYV